uniref:Uncharacterized protein n=1 Tax=Sexangularia sp. CB-2014 TaxID=1486929 RepID=A0A7S1VE98_9EUKA
MAHDKPYLTLFIFTCIVTTNGWSFLISSPISTLLAQFFRVSLINVSLLTLLYMIASFIGIPVVLFILTRKEGERRRRREESGVDVGVPILGVLLLSAAMLNATGTTGKAIIALFAAWQQPSDTVPATSTHYTLYLLSQAAAALAQPVLIVVPPLLSNLYFTPDSRALATAVGSLGTVAGIALGLTPGAFMIAPSSYGQTHHKEELDVTRFAIVLTTCAVIADLAAIGLAIIATRYGLAGGSTTTTTTTTVVPSDGSPSSPPPSPPPPPTPPPPPRPLYRNVPFLRLLVTFSIAYGAISTLYATLSLSLGISGFTNRHAALLGGAMVGLGLLGAGLASVWLDRTKRFTTALLVGTTSTTASFAIFCLLSSTPSLITSVDLRTVCLTASLLLLGFCSTAVLPLALECGVELTFPHSEVTSSSVLLLGGSAVGTGLLSMVGATADAHGGVQMSLRVIGMLCLLAVLPIVLPGKWRWRRTEWEEARKVAGRTSIQHGERVPLLA